MQWIKQHIALVILALIVFLMGIFIKGLLARLDQARLTAAGAEARALRELVAAKDQTIQHLMLDNVQLDASNADHRKTDSLLLERLLANQPKYVANEKKLKEVAAAVHSLDRDQLRREFTNY